MPYPVCISPSNSKHEQNSLSNRQPLSFSRETIKLHGLLAGLGSSEATNEYIGSSHWYHYHACLCLLARGCLSTLIRDSEELMKGMRIVPACNIENQPTDKFVYFVYQSVPSFEIGPVDLV